MDTATIQTWLSIIKDIATIFAACVAGYVGLAGLDAWRKQLTANAERDLARRVLVAVYRARDAINHCRLPGFADVNDDTEAKVVKKMHDEGIAELDKAEANLDVELLEAEAVWGDDPIYHLSFSMFSVLITQVGFEHMAYYSDDADAKEKEEACSVLFTDGSGDEFSNRVKKAVKRIEDVLRPKLTLKQIKRKKTHWWNRFKKQKKQQP